MIDDDTVRPHDAGSTFREEAEQEAWLDSLPRSSTGKVQASEYIAYLAFTESAQFSGKVAFDMRRRCPVTTGTTPAGPAGPWTTGHTMSMAIWMQSHGVPIKPIHIDNALISVAKLNEINPLEAWLYSLEWDGVPRIGTWLHVYCGADDTLANSIMGSKWLIGAAARALQPGCRMDYMLVLEGLQGARKSTLVKVLGAGYAGENLPDFHSRDAMQMAAYHWIIEISELAAMRKSEVEHIKAFLSRTEDSYILKYEKFPMSLKRQCVLLGNMNPDGNGYLQDSTGNRRFWPVKVQQIDIEALKQDRDQLWAEAVHCFLRGDKWWLENGENESVAEQQQLRRAEDPWEDLIVQWCAARIGTFTIIDVAVSALQLKPGDINRSVSIRIGMALKLLGYERKRLREDGKLNWVYERPELP